MRPLRLVRSETQARVDTLLQVLQDEQADRRGEIAVVAPALDPRQKSRVVTPSLEAICRMPSQNSASRLILVLRPAMTTERLNTVVFILFQPR